MEFRIGNKVFSLTTGRFNSGSGKSIVSVGREHAIQINVSTAYEIYTIYRDYPIVFRIINDITNAIRNTPIWISDKKGEIINDSTKKFQSLIQKPNRYQNTGNIAADIAFELITFGRCIIIKRDYSFDKEFFILRNCDIDSIEYKSEFMSEKSITKIKYRKYDENGNWVYDTFKENKNIFELNLNYELPNFSKFSNYSECFNCPIVSVRSELEAYANMVDCLAENYGDGGARKIISFKNGDGSYSYSKEILPDEEKALHDKFSEGYGKNKGDRKYVITTQEVNTSDLSLPTQQLDIPATKPALEMSICAPFCYPPQLIGVKTGAYKSQTEAEEAFYIRCVSPLANRILASLNEIFETNIVGKIELDYGVYDFFQYGKQQKGTAIQTLMQGCSQAIENGVLTTEEVKRELIDIL